MSELDRNFYNILGALELIGMAVFLGMSIWFYIFYSDFTIKNYDPRLEETVLGITYDFDAITVVFIAFSLISFITYTVGGALFLMKKGPGMNVNHKTLLLSTSIITGILSIGLIANGILSLENNSKIKKTYDDEEKQIARDLLKFSQVPYTELGITSLVSGVVGLILMITLISYFYIMLPKPPPQPVPVKKQPTVVKQGPDFLKRGKIKPDRTSG